MLKFTDLQEYKNASRINGNLCCVDCKREYSTFQDLFVPYDIWEQINPSPIKEGGILCPTCIINRLHKLGYSKNGAYELCSDIYRKEG